MKNLRKIFATIVVFGLVFGACKKADIEKAAQTQEPNSMAVHMTDNPGDYLRVDMELKQVEVYMEGKGWIALESKAQFVNVASLTNGKSALIASRTKLESGHYTKVKLLFGSNNKITAMTDIGGSGIRIAQETTLEFDGNKEIIVEIDANVNAQAGTEVWIDFDIVKSIKKDAQKYIVKPFLVWLKDRKTAVSGEIQGSVTAALVLTNGQDSVSAFTDIQGKFYIRGAKAGVYNLVIYPAYKTVEDNLKKPLKVEGIVITEGEVKYLGTIQVQ